MLCVAWGIAYHTASTSVAEQRTNDFHFAQRRWEFFEACPNPIPLALFSFWKCTSVYPNRHQVISNLHWCRAEGQNQTLSQLPKHTANKTNPMVQSLARNYPAIPWLKIKLKWKRLPCFSSSRVAQMLSDPSSRQKMHPPHHLNRSHLPLSLRARYS